MSPNEWDPAMDVPITTTDIESAFAMLLGRSPGPQGLAHFQTHCVDAGWTRRMLRSAIMASPEYQRQFYRPVQFDGFTLIVDPNDPDFGRNLVRNNGGYEEHNLAILRRILKPGDTFVDIGANMGLLSLTGRAAVGKAGRVICFEPMANNAALLTRSIIANGFGNVILYPVALSDTVKTLYIEGNSNGKLMSKGQLDRQITTALGDDYLDKEVRIDFVKMDIEGHEPLALRGIARALKRHQPILLIEFSPGALKANCGWDAEAFAEEIFAMTPEVKAIDYDGKFEVVQDARDLMALWVAKNRFYADQGRIADGVCHFDLLFKVGSGIEKMD